LRSSAAAAFALALMHSNVSAEPSSGPAISSPLGDFGSDEPIERADLPSRGVLTFKMEDKNKTFAQGEHWEQYNFPFTAKRWGKYAVRLTYTLKSSSLGVQFKFGEERLKKQITATGGQPKHAWLGEIYIPAAGDQFMSLYTPNGVGWSSFELVDISLVPTAEGSEITQTENGSVELLAKDATTWSENMRYEPKPEKNCLGFWTQPEDFAEWEMKVDKPGKYQITVHQGSSTGGSEVSVQFDSQKLKFTVKNTGDFHKPEAVHVGEVKVDKPGTYRLAIKPRTKNGNAIMDVQKVVLTPVS
ncbi:MAG TPA: DUF5077 domain-containing protein, partial [Verrucomicrobiaceae bacterium]